MRNKISIFFEKIVPIFIILLVCGALYFIINKQLKEHYDQDDPKLKEIKEKFAIFFSKDIKWEKSLDMLNHRDIMQEKYPFFEFVFKNESQKGHPQSLNIMLEKVNTKYVFLLEDDWETSAPLSITDYVNFLQDQDYDQDQDQAKDKDK